MYVCICVHEHKYEYEQMCVRVSHSLGLRFCVGMQLSVRETPSFLVSCLGRWEDKEARPSWRFTSATPVVL